MAAQPWHSQDELDDQIQFFVSQGFNVLDPNYRGSTGFNLAYREAIKVDGWGGREQDDIRTGIEALIDAGIAEPRQGGHNRDILRRVFVVVWNHAVSSRIFWRHPRRFAA